MDLIESILAKIATDPDKLSGHEISIASLFELRSMNVEITSVKKELVSLNDKIDKIGEESKISVQTLESKYDKKILEIETRVKINEEARIEGAFWKKAISSIPVLIGAIVGITSICIFVYNMIIKLIH